MIIPAAFSLLIFSLKNKKPVITETITIPILFKAKIDELSRNTLVSLFRFRVLTRKPTEPRLARPNTVPANKTLFFISSLNLILLKTAIMIPAKADIVNRDAVKAIVLLSEIKLYCAYFTNESTIPIPIKSKIGSEKYRKPDVPAVFFL